MNLHKRSSIKIVLAALCIFSVLILAAPTLSLAEPWLATRFAQNCAGCHAPGRYNVKLKDRRCTLSCQGCHVNPNGGGLRNQYGKWNSDRWLRSYDWKKMHGKEKEKPLPWFGQHYISDRDASAVAKTLEDWGVRKKTSAKSGKGRKSKRRSKNYAAELHPKSVPDSATERKALVKAIEATKKLRGKKDRWVNTQRDFPSFDFSEFYFERANGDSNWVPEVGKKKFESVIPANDPYFKKKREEVLVGLDYRLMAITPIDSEQEDTYIWPMALDIGLQWKPAIRKFDNVSLIVETRYQNQPQNSDLDYSTTSTVQNRSTYILIDDLVYNFFFMTGMYKPMFEHYTPDHTSLAQNILYAGGGYKVLYKAVSIGTAPNVPFVNFHLIQPMTNSKSAFNQDEGFVVNLGARWVTYGASIVYSYRSTNDKKDVNNFNTTAHSLAGGLTWKNLIVNAEALNITKEFAPGKVDSGTIFTTEFRYKIWRELYAESVIESANVSGGGFTGDAQALKAGDASQFSLGMRFYPVSGMNYSVHYRTTNNNPTDGTEYKATVGLIQAHLYF